MTRNQPIRTCVGCRSKRGKYSLVRFVATPDGRILLDARQRMPGRGAYLCAERSCLEQARKKKALARTLKIPPSKHGVMTEELWQELGRRLENFASVGGKRSEEGVLNEQTG